MFLVWTIVRFIPAIVGSDIIILAKKYLERIMIVTEAVQHPVLRIVGI